MNPEQFCTWLKGFVEITEKYPTEGEWELIVQKLMKVGVLKFPVDLIDPNKWRSRDIQINPIQPPQMS